MEARYENSANVRLDVLNAVIALTQTLNLNHLEIPKNISIVVEMENGKTVTEKLTSTDIEKIIAEQIENQQAA